MHTDPRELAREIADALNDVDAIPLYEQFARKYPEDLLRRILAKTLSIPMEKIRRTRGALFTYLVNNHPYHGTRHTRD